MHILRVLVSLSFVVGTAIYTECQCTSTPSTQRTSWGQENVVMVHPEPVKKVQGKVTDIGGRPLAGVLAEVYDHPEVVLPEARSDRKGQQRLNACITGKDGKFSFRLPPGRYELRFSKPVEWNATSVLVEVGGPKASAKSMKVWLMIAQ